MVLKAQKPWMISQTAWNVHKQLPDESTSVRMLSYIKVNLVNVYNRIYVNVLDYWKGIRVGINDS